MATKTLNISIPINLWEFLQQYPELSPSKMFQSKVVDVMNTKKNSEVELVKLKRSNAFFQRKILELSDEINRLKGGGEK